MNEHSRATLASTQRLLIRSAIPASLVVTGLLLLCVGMDADAVTSWLHDFGNAAPLVFVVIGVVFMSILVPKTFVSIAAGALFGTGMGTALMLVTAVTAAIINYAIGRWWLGGSVSTWLQRDDSDPRQELIRMGGLVTKDAGWFVHLLFRLTPVPTMVISYLMGACHARVIPFVAAAAIAIIPQSLWVHGGTAVRLVDDADAGRLHWAGVAISIIAAIAIGVLVPRLAIARLQSERVEDPNTNIELELETEMGTPN